MAVQESDPRNRKLRKVPRRPFNQSSSGVPSPRSNSEGSPETGVTGIHQRKYRTGTTTPKASNSPHTVRSKVRLSMPQNQMMSLKIQPVPRKVSST